MMGTICNTHDEKRDMNKNLGHENNIEFGKPKCRGVGNIKKNLSQIICTGLECGLLAGFYEHATDLRVA
jgi:hypothetical protein